MSNDAGVRQKGEADVAGPASSVERGQRGSDRRGQEDQLRCPACRARQTQRPRCRRCGADLELYVRLLRRLTYLEGRLDSLRAGPDRQRALRELRQLAPGRAAPYR